MPCHSLEKGGKPNTVGLILIYDSPHLLALSLRQLYVPRGPVLLQPLRLGGSGNRDHALRCDPSECDLRDGAAFLGSQAFDSLYDGLVLVEIIALELGYCGK